MNILNQGSKLIISHSVNIQEKSHEFNEIGKMAHKSPKVHLITQVILQRIATSMDVVTTGMPLLNQQTQRILKVGTLEKNVASIETVENS